MPNIVVIPEGATVIWGEDEEGVTQWQKLIMADGSEFYTWMAPVGEWGGPIYVAEQQIAQ